jgi:DNA-directed RNA polymerase subunit M/transcription elongation factor TFIIS
MSTSDHPFREMSAEEYTAEYNADNMSGRTTDIANGRKANRSKVMLSAVVTCPSCGKANKPEWLNKARNSDAYATTMWCEQCGGLIAVWATHVEAQIVTPSPSAAH